MEGKYASQWCLGLLILFLAGQELSAAAHRPRDAPLQTLLARRACDDYEPKECPDKDGPFPVFLPDDKSCSRFYECSNGLAIIKDCPDGLDYDRWQHVCELPSVAGCNDCS